MSYLPFSSVTGHVGFSGGCLVTGEAWRFTWLRFDLKDLGFVYAFLCALSLTAINPWGTPRGGIWTDPKVYALITLTLVTLALLLGLLAQFTIQALRRLRVPLIRWGVAWWLVAGVAALFLFGGLLTAYYSPVSTFTALTPQTEMGDGWLYWFWLLGFVLGNALLLRRFPQLFRAQLCGILAGGALMALSTLPQALNWRLDYTDTMGRAVIRPNGLSYLYSTVYQGQMPIGLTSHRGHAAFVVAATALLALVSLLRGWIGKRYAWPLYGLSGVAIYLTSTRGAQIAFVAGLLYLLVRFWRTDKRARRMLLIAFLPLVLGGVVLVSAPLLGLPRLTRPLPPLKLLFTRPDDFLSLRTDYWRVALEGVRQRPLLGWGYDGFGFAFPYANDFDRQFATYLDQEEGRPVPIERMQGTNHTYFRYFGPDGFIHRGTIMSNKAHNIFLDMAVSVGLVGLGSYMLLLGSLTFFTVRGRGWGLEAVTVVYIVYGLTWFDSAQFTHLAWWVFSAGLALQVFPERKGAARRLPSFDADAA